MSFRGGRGGARGGLKGATWEHDPSVKLESAPSELFPKHPNLRPQAPLTKREKSQVKNFKVVQEAVYRGPLYTHPTKNDTDAPAKTFGQDQFNRQYGGRSKATVDPFVGVETYSQKYNPPKRTIPNLKAVSLDKKMFPKELWGTLDGDEGEEVKQHLNNIMKRKSRGDPNSKVSTDRSTVLLEKIKKVTGEDDDDGKADDGDEEGVPEEEEDYDYEEDEGEMGGDYDAEKYFDDGENDEEDGEAGGEDY